MTMMKGGENIESTKDATPVRKLAKKQPEWLTVKRIGMIFIMIALLIGVVSSGILGAMAVVLALMGYYVITHEKQIVQQANR